MTQAESANSGFQPYSSYDLNASEIWRFLWDDEDHFSDDTMEVVNDIRDLYEAAVQGTEAGTLVLHGGHVVLLDGGYWFNAWKSLIESGVVDGGMRDPTVWNLPSSHYDPNFFNQQHQPANRRNRDPFLTYSPNANGSQWEIRFPSPVRTADPSQQHFGCLLFGLVDIEHRIPQVHMQEIINHHWQRDYQRWLQARFHQLGGARTTSVWCAYGPSRSRFSIPASYIPVGGAAFIPATGVVTMQRTCTWFQTEAHPGTGRGGRATYWTGFSGFPTSVASGLAQMAEERVTGRRLSHRQVERREAVAPHALSALSERITTGGGILYWASWASTPSWLASTAVPFFGGDSEQIDNIGRHGADFIRYKITGRQIGPFGSSPYVEKKGMELLCYPPVPNRQ
jgi:hypothetical protein